MVFLSKSTGLTFYRKLVVHGFAVDEEGHKMAKSVGNVVDPGQIINGHSVRHRQVVGINLHIYHYYSSKMYCYSNFVRFKQYGQKVVFFYFHKYFHIKKSKMLYCSCSDKIYKIIKSCINSHQIMNSTVILAV